MSSKKIPSKLKHTTIVDAIFEIRFSQKIPDYRDFVMALYSKLQFNNKQAQEIEQNKLIPREIRDIQPSLRYLYLDSILGDNIIINIGEFVLNITVKYPYNGWLKFKEEIKNTLEILFSIDSVKEHNINRYSLRYINAIDTHKLGLSSNNFLQYLDIDLELSHFKYSKTNFTIQLFQDNEQIKNIINLHAPYNANIVDRRNMDPILQIKNSILVDMDSILELTNEESFTIENLLKNIDQKDSNLDQLHNNIKNIFFSCLSEDIINKLEPTYD